MQFLAFSPFCLLHAPFCWVPGVIVPMVIFSHLTALLQLRSGAKPAP